MKEQDDQLNITFIGGGNMAQSIVMGLLSDSTFSGALNVSDPAPQVVENYSAVQDRIQFFTDNHLAIQGSHVVVLAVKPNQMAGVCQQALRMDVEREQSLVLSIAAGVTSSAMAAWLGEKVAIVRCMPNTPSLVNAGVSGLYANARCCSTQRHQATSIMQAVGLVTWLQEESDLDVLTAISGSGPAYFFYLMEAMLLSAERLGFDPEMAQRLVSQTALGAAQMAVQANKSPKTLRENVTSKGGTTAMALQQFDQFEFKEMVDQAMSAAMNRAIEMGEEYQ